MGKIFGISDILNAVFNRDANKLKVETDLQIDAVTVTDVTIRDAVATNNKLKVNKDGSVPVELKGSLVETYKAVNNVVSNFTVAAGALATIYTYNSNTDPVDMISVLVKAPSTEFHDYSVYYRWYIGEYSSPFFSKFLCSSNRSYIAYTEEPIKVISPHMFQIQVKNNDTIDHNYEYLSINYFYRRF